MYRQVLQKTSYINTTTEGWKEAAAARKSELFRDLKALHCAASDRLFEDGIKQFVKRWGRTHPLLVKYFVPTWVLTKAGWYIGAYGIPWNVPRHTCAVEGINHACKTGNVTCDILYL